MPAFTFEKISPPDRRGPVAPVANKKQRGVIVQILDRFVETRVKRTRQEEEHGVIVQILGRFVEARVKRSKKVGKGVIARRKSPD